MYGVSLVSTPRGAVKSLRDAVDFRKEPWESTIGSLTGRKNLEPRVKYS
jgi:hypothetical protein